MFAVFYDTSFEKIDEIQMNEVYSYTKDSIEYDEGRLNKISSLFIICEDEDKDSISIDDLQSFYSVLIADDLKEQNDKRINSSFYSPTFDAYFAFAEKDQNRIDQELTLLSMGLSTETIEWNSIDSGLILMTHEQFKIFCTEARTHTRDLTNEYWRIREKLMNCDSLEKLKAIDSIEEAEMILDTTT